MSENVDQVVRHTLGLLAADQVSEHDMADLVIALRTARLRANSRSIAARHAQAKRKFEQDSKAVQLCLSLREQGCTYHQISKKTGLDYSKVARNLAGVKRGASK